MDELLKTARRTGTAVLPHIASFHRLASRIVSASSFRSSHRSHRGVRAFTHRPAHDVLHRAVIIIITITITSSPSPSLSSSPPANHAFAMPIDEPSPPRQLTDDEKTSWQKRRISQSPRPPADRIVIANERKRESGTLQGIGEQVSPPPAPRKSTDARSSHAPGAGDYLKPAD